MLLFLGCLWMLLPPLSAQNSNPNANVVGTVVDTTGSAIAGARVSLRDAVGKTAASGITNAEGRFTLTGVAPGKYALRAENKNFETASREIEVASTSANEMPLVITLKVAGVQQSVNVTAAGSYVSPDSLGATKTEMPIMETPVSVQVVPQAVLKDQQVVALDQAIQNVSGVIPNNDSYGTGDSFSIRGFDAMEMTYEDGLRLDQYSTSGFPVDIANTERVEVIKGPASVLYGQAEPGGVVNIVTKKPLDAAHYSLEQQAGSYDFYQTILDATGPLFSKKFYYRFVLDYINSGSFRDFVFTDRFSVYPSIEWKPNDKTQLIGTFNYNTGTQVLDNGIPFLSDGTPANVPISRNYAEPNSNQSPTNDYYFKVALWQSLPKNWQLRIVFKNEFHNEPTANQIIYLGDADSQGDLARFGFTSPVFKQLTNQVVSDVLGKVSWLGLQHSLLMGFDYYHQNGHYSGNSYVPAVINIYNPVYGQPPLVPVDPTQAFTVQDGQTAYGFYLQDQVKLPKGFFLLAGVRFNWVNAFDTGYGQASSVNDRPSPTPRVGLLWQPKSWLSAYGSYTSNYGATPLGSLTPDGKTLPPEAAQQYEVGIKTEWLQKRLVATAAVYQITKQNIPAADPSNPLYTIAIGEARSRGFELDVSGQIGANWRIIGGYSYINAIVTKDTNMPSLQGLRFPDAPYDSGSIWAVYDVPRGALHGLKLGAGSIARSGQVNYESPDGVTYLTDTIPGFGIVNVMAGYVWQFEKVRLNCQLNINNLLDKTYFFTVNPSQAMPGAPITVLPAIRVEF